MIVVLEKTKNPCLQNFILQTLGNLLHLHHKSEIKYDAH